MGLSNPLRRRSCSTCRSDKVVGTVTCGSAYEGPPGHVHGGYVAALFDELLGLTQSLSGKHGMTGRLTVHYRSPTPLHTELRVEGTLDRSEGRKILCSGRMYAGDTLVRRGRGSVHHRRLRAAPGDAGRARRLIRSLTRQSSSFGETGSAS